MGLLDSIIGAESGGNANATNPNSSAAGAGQFINSTWLDMMRRYRPDIQGSDAEILAMRSDPDLSRQMTANYATENQKALTAAGVPVTDGTTYLAHFAGPQGAVKVLQADPSAPVASILGDAAVKANPFLRGMTASDLQAWADRKMGGGKTAQASPASPPTALPQVAAQQPLRIAPTAPPMFPPAVPQQQAQQEPAPSYWQQFPADQAQAAPPMFSLMQPRRPQVDISKLRQALGNGGLFFRGRA